MSEIKANLHYNREILDDSLPYQREFDGLHKESSWAWLKEKGEREKAIF